MRRRMTPRTAQSAATDDRNTRIYYWWFLLAITFEYIRPGVFFPPIEATKLNSLIPLTLLVAVLFAPGLRPFKTIFADRYARWLLVYMGLILVSIPFATVTLYSTDVFKKVLANFFLFMILARVATSVQRLRGIFAVLLLCHMFLVLMNPDLILKPDVRSYINGAPFLGDGNDFALSLCILLPMAIELAGGARSRAQSALAWGAVALVLVAIIGTQSRGSALAVCGILGFLWSFSTRKAATMGGILAVGAIVAIFGSQAYFQRMESIKDYESDGSAKARISAWKAGFRMGLGNPVLGVGAGHFPMAIGTKYKPPDAESNRWMTAHSMYFLIFGELGIPGIVTLFALVFGGIRANLALRRRTLKTASDPPSDDMLQISRMLLLLSASGVGLAVAGAFLSVAYYPHIFMLTGIMLSARSIAFERVNAALTGDVPGGIAKQDRGRRGNRSAQLPKVPGRSVPPHGNGRYVK
jgi:probable O-glycosylation ligase (exosortase A-associated)